MSDTTTRARRFSRVISTLTVTMTMTASLWSGGCGGGASEPGSRDGGGTATQDGSSTAVPGRSGAKPGKADSEVLGEDGSITPDSGSHVEGLDAAAPGDGAIDGGGPDGGDRAPDGGPEADSGGASEPPTCYDAHEGVVFCEDFEAAELVGWSAYAEGPDGKTQRTTLRTHAGAGALESIKRDPGDSAPIYADVLGKRTSGRLYLRAYLYVPSGFSITPAGSRASLLVLGESGGALGGLSLVLWEDAVSLQINGQAMSEVKAEYALPRGRWLCTQIDFAIGASADARLRIDGELIAQGTRNTLLTTSYDRLWLGVNWIAPEQAQDVQVFYDDVVVDTRDVPCD